jgi:hypothetical protein
MNAVMEGSREYVYHGIWLNTRPHLFLATFAFQTLQLIRDSSASHRFGQSDLLKLLAFERDPWGNQGMIVNKWKVRGIPPSIHNMSTLSRTTLGEGSESGMGTDPHTRLALSNCKLDLPSTPHAQLHGVELSIPVIYVFLSSAFLWMERAR